MRSHTHGFYGKLVGLLYAVCQKVDLKVMLHWSTCQQLALQVDQCKITSKKQCFRFLINAPVTFLCLVKFGNAQNFASPPQIDQ